jgi:hypothetical protein
MMHWENSRPLTEIAALQLVRAAAKVAPPTPHLDRAIQFLDRLIVRVVDHGEATIRLGVEIVP